MSVYEIDKNLLVSYVKKKHIEKYDAEITPLKLQKSLYFLFGYWILEKAVSFEGENCSADSYLFESNFQAWKYGPVDVDVYRKRVKGDIPNATVDHMLEMFLDDKLERIFKLSDFTLVNLTHNHECWKQNYNEDSEQHNIPISEDDIKKTFKGFL